MDADSHAAFPPTRWSMVIAAADQRDLAAGERALGELCAIYWRPLYSFARRRGASPADAADLVQGFFARMLGENLFGRADAGLGRLRSYLLGAFQRYQRDEWRRQGALKRGAGAAPLSIDEDSAERMFQAEDTATPTPEAAYEKQCALALLSTTLARLAAEQVEEGKGAQFELFRPLLAPLGGEAESGHETIAAKLGLSAEASRAVLSRLRKRFRQLLRDTVADTLAEPSAASVDEELDALRAALVG